MLNSAIVMGRLTADPELKTTNSGTNFTRFCVAVDRSFQKPGEEKQTDFINVLAWTKTAEFIDKYFFKGDMIAVDGSIQTGSYTDKNAVKRTSFEIVAREVSFCGSKKENKPNNSYSKPNLNADFDEIVSDDDLPF